MNRRLLILGACIAVALAATASPALADGQSTAGSLVTGQIGTIELSPNSAAAAPVNADAPVCVLSACAEAGGAQSSAASTAAGGSTEGAGDDSQSNRHSVGTVQAGSVGLAPATALNAPITANAPVCALAACRGGAAPHGAGSSIAGSTTGSHRDSAPQSTERSVGTVQIAAVDAKPATSAAAPVGINAPVCVLAACEGTASNDTHGGAAATSTDASGPGRPAESAGGSAGTVQLEPIGLRPATVLSTPVSVDAPVCVLASCAVGGTAPATASVGSSTPSVGGVSPLRSARAVANARVAGTTAPARIRKLRQAPRGGVLGTEPTPTRRHAPDAAPFSGVLATVAAVKRLPFTGVRLWEFLLAGLALLALGAGTRARLVA
jgi:hypothetical protein